MDIDRLFAVIPNGGPPELDYELRAAIAEYAIVEGRLAHWLGSRNIVGQLGEVYVAVALDGTLATNSKAGYDLTLPDGTRVQVKTRRGDKSGGGEFGGFTTLSVEQGQFDVATFVRLDKDLLPMGALSLPRHAIAEVAKPRGGKLVCFWSDVARRADRQDIGAAVSARPALGLRPDQEPDRDLLDEADPDRP